MSLIGLELPVFVFTTGPLDVLRDEKLDLRSTSLMSMSFSLIGFSGLSKFDNFIRFIFTRYSFILDICWHHSCDNVKGIFSVPV